MRGLPCVIPLLIGLCLLAACGIKGPPQASETQVPSSDLGTHTAPPGGPDSRLLHAYHRDALDPTCSRLP